ncbi:MAG: GGDEF domain-containing protein [Armatimonadetes bacterium]|nr:GGDEF domain-containing protein [Armatimonadota bacterium]
MCAFELTEETRQQYRLPPALAAAADPLDTLVVLGQTGARRGLDFWLLGAEADVWHGYVYSKEPVDTGAVQLHLREMAERFLTLRPQATAQPGPSGVFPLMTAFEVSGEVAADCAEVRDFEISLGGNLFALLRVGLLQPEAQPDWQEAGHLVELATPYLAYLLARQEEDEQALRDPLTGVYSRAYFNDQLAREVQRSAAYACQLSLLVIELVPARGRGAVSLQAIKRCAEVLRKNTRRTDVTARVGPARFAILMPHTGSRDALMAADRLSEIVERERDEAEGFTMSIGISGWNLQGPDAAELMDQATEAARMASQGTGGPFLYV